MMFTAAAAPRQAARPVRLTPLQLEPFLGTIFLEFSIGRDLGALKGLRDDNFRVQFSIKAVVRHACKQGYYFHCMAHTLGS